MFKDNLPQSALAHLRSEPGPLEVGSEADVRLSERPFRGQIVLRGNLASPEFVAGVQTVLGMPVPAEPNTVAQRGELGVLWLGPNEWLIVVPDGQEYTTATALRGAFGGQHVAVTDVSDGRVIIGLAGRHAREVLMKGCSLDLHARAFGPGRCAQTRLARCHMLLWQVDAAPAYEIYVHRSYADYVWRWLEDAAREYRLAVAVQPR